MFLSLSYGKTVKSSCLPSSLGFSCHRVFFCPLRPQSPSAPHVFWRASSTACPGAPWPLCWRLAELAHSSGCLCGPGLFAWFIARRYICGQHIELMLCLAAGWHVFVPLLLIILGTSLKQRMGNSFFFLTLKVLHVVF